MAIVLIAYVGHYLLVKFLGVRAVRAFGIPPLFLVLLLFLLVGFLFQGLAFALDLYWIPATVAVALLAFAVYQLFDTDHFFSLGLTRVAGGVPATAPTAQAATAEAQTRASGVGQGPLELVQAATAWKFPHVAGDADQTGLGGRTLVAVTASGGGIQSAAWTARALVGLHERYGRPFTNSIGLVSAVSGGSVGAMYRLDAWPSWDPTQPATEWRYPLANPQLPPPGSVCDRAMASSLEATAWGAVFPDLLRLLVPIPVLVDRSDDRGARIEEIWRGHLNQPLTPYDGLDLRR